ncbi:MAG: hypothetical protein P4L44_13505 [Oryzomonas sp.]|uniref:hypothetical protein n=1 Tax=Oryzomonas sp. TaxID=2855186 RepID=UPI0028471C31|nr:hypothetical protein [Oryzomonas sp.]MDR3580971.1 hypothetical protein [Oryzomonas sp.]
MTIIGPPHAKLQAMPECDQGIIAGYVVKPAENAGSTLFAAEMVLGEGRRIFREIDGVLRDTWIIFCPSFNYLFKLSN